MKNYYLFFFVALVVALVIGCSSGKKAYNRGDYYAAVLKAVNRLRKTPNHKVSSDILRKSYQLAVNTVDSDVKNLIAINAPFKWKKSMEKYNLINVLYQEIHTSPAALRIIPDPVNRFEEVKNLKEKAAEESYQAGLEALMKSTRDDAKKAYYLFQEASTLVEHYKESVEMMEKAKDVATLRVVVEVLPYPEKNFEPVIFAYSDPFIKFLKEGRLPIQDADQYLTLYPPDFSESEPEVESRKQQYTDSVKTGEKKTTGGTVPVYEEVKATLTVYTKTIKAVSTMRLTIITGEDVSLRDTKIKSSQKWTREWFGCQGDKRALPEKYRDACGRAEPYMEDRFLLNATNNDLNDQLAAEVKAFYSKY